MSAPLTFTDTRGLSWTVYELPPGRIEFDGRVVEEHPAHLTFELTTGDARVLRRVADYPADWRELSSDALETLCARAGDAAMPGFRTESGELRRHLDELST